MPSGEISRAVSVYQASIRGAWSIRGAHDRGARCGIAAPALGHPDGRRRANSSHAPRPKSRVSFRRTVECSLCRSGKNRCASRMHRERFVPLGRYSHRERVLLCGRFYGGAACRLVSARRDSRGSRNTRSQCSSISCVMLLQYK